MGRDGISRPDTRMRHAGRAEAFLQFLVLRLVPEAGAASRWRASVPGWDFVVLQEESDLGFVVVAMTPLQRVSDPGSLLHPGHPRRYNLPAPNAPSRHALDTAAAAHPAGYTGPSASGTAARRKGERRPTLSTVSGVLSTGGSTSAARASPGTEPFLDMAAATVSVGLIHAAFAARGPRGSLPAVPGPAACPRGGRGLRAGAPRCRDGTSCSPSGRE